MAALSFVSGFWSSSAVAQSQPRISPDAQRAVAGFTLAPGVQALVFATDPLVANPVALEIDEQSRVYVCETFRQNRGVEDNRQHAEWIDDDLSATTTDDRLAYLKKHLGDSLQQYSEQQDRLRMLVDTDGDGRADRATNFADGFRGPLVGTGAGVLARKGNVYYTCIPTLWALRDDDDDGQSDRKLALATGFGVRTAFRGHDLHGLALGPDGRLYFSIGDRGYHVKTKQGLLADAESGAIFRCEQDGSRLEVFATGFRNPQELAFDDLGNLFTGDNNSDSGDRARWVHVLEGGDSGWRMAYQYMPDRGPWNRERLWHLPHSGQAAYIVPPVAHLGDGPAGLAYYPGTGLPEHYVGNFFLCDFRGDAGQSGIRTFKVRPQGASFQLMEPEIFLWNCLATDVDFGPDGAIYVADWVDGWDGTGKGRIYRLTHADAARSQQVADVVKLLSADLSQVDGKELARRLEHADRRVRQQAQMELAVRRDTQTLLESAHQSSQQLARLHAVWGLGQIARVSVEHQEFMSEVVPLLHDADPEVRIAAATIVGESRYAKGAERLRGLLNDNSPRVQAAAALASGKLADRKAVPRLQKRLADNADRDPALRHALVMGLVGCATPRDLRRLADASESSVRLGALLAMRRLKSPQIERFLNDAEPLLVLEAARAIYDLPIAAALPKLAALIGAERDAAATGDADRHPVELMRRVVAANYRLGEPTHAIALAQFAADQRQPLAVRVAALNLLGNWAQPAARDPIVGMWRPLDPRPVEDARQALSDALPELVRGGLDVRLRAVQLAASLNIEQAGPLLLEMLENQELPAEERAGVLLALEALAPPGFDSIIQEQLQANAPRLRVAARVLLTRRQPDRAFESLRAAIEDGELVEKKSAIALIANLATPAADQVIQDKLTQMIAGKIAPEMQLELLIASRRRGQDNAQIAEQLRGYDAQRDPQDPLSPYRETLHGGNAERGELLFFERIELSCVRCHRVGDVGGQVGPALTSIGKDKSREYLLESLVDPNKTIAKGFETVVLQLQDGSTVTGIIQEQNEKSTVVIDAQAQIHRVLNADIEHRDQGQSAMPADLLRYMNLFDLRDIVEYLASLHD